MKIKHFVRQSLFYGFIMCLAHAEELPNIDVHQATVVPIEMSKTGRIYRFKMDAKELPLPGKIILIQESERPIMAFRVLQTDEATGEWVGKRVRRYDVERQLKLKESYDSIEKIADLVAPPPPEMKYDVNAKPELGGDSLMTRNSLPSAPPLNPDAPPELDPLPEITNQAQGQIQPTPKPRMDINAYDEELDAGAGMPEPSPELDMPTEPGAPVEEEEPGAPIASVHEIQDKVIFSPYKRTISVTLNSFRNMSSFVIRDSNKSVNNGFGVNYAFVVDRGLLTPGSALQDSLAFETGFGYYNRTDFSGTFDSYSIAPLKAELHYQLHTSESFTAFGYAGFQFNWIFSADPQNTSSAAVNRAYDALQGIQHTIGVGIYYNIGPQWYLRTDLGWDRMGIGLAVRW